LKIARRLPTKSSAAPKKTADFIQFFAPYRCEETNNLPETISAKLAAFLLVEWNLYEAFAMLCALPRKGVASLRVLVCPGSGQSGQGFLIEVLAEFGSVEKAGAGEWNEFTNQRDRVFEPEKILRDSPMPICARILARLDSENLTCTAAEANRYTGPLAVIRNPCTAAQWRERFEADRWFESDILPQDRLTDKFDLRTWLRLFGPIS
jgi:hypothetical protein